MEGNNWRVWCGHSEEIALGEEGESERVFLALETVCAKRIFLGGGEEAWSGIKIRDKSRTRS